MAKSKDGAALVMEPDETAPAAIVLGAPKAVAPEATVWEIGGFNLQRLGNDAMELHLVIRSSAPSIKGAWPESFARVNAMLTRARAKTVTSPEHETYQAAASRLAERMAERASLLARVREIEGKLADPMISSDTLEKLAQEEGRIKSRIEGLNRNLPSLQGARDDAARALERVAIASMAEEKSIAQQKIENHRTGLRMTDDYLRELIVLDLVKGAIDPLWGQMQGAALAREITGGPVPPVRPPAPEPVPYRPCFGPEAYAPGLRYTGEVGCPASTQ